MLSNVPSCTLSSALLLTNSAYQPQPKHHAPTLAPFLVAIPSASIFTRKCETSSLPSCTVYQVRSRRDIIENPIKIVESMTSATHTSRQAHQMKNPSQRACPGDSLSHTPASWVLLNPAPQPFRHEPSLKKSIIIMSLLLLTSNASCENLTCREHRIGASKKSALLVTREHAIMQCTVIKVRMDFEYLTVLRAIIMRNIIHSNKSHIHTPISSVVLVEDVFPNRCLDHVHLLHCPHKHCAILLQVLLNDIMARGCPIAYRLHLQFHLRFPNGLLRLVSNSRFS